IDILPDITYPSITVVTNYEGAGPQEVERLITEIIEKNVSTIENVKDIRSTSGEDASNVTIDFNWGTNLDEAANDIREKLDRVRRFLPEDADDPFLYKYDPSSRPIIFFSLKGPIHPSGLRDLADDRIKYDIEQIEGVAAVDIWGGLEREIQVEVNRGKLRSIGLSINALVGILNEENLSLPGGRLETGRTEWLIRPLGEFSSMEDIENIIVATRQGRPIYLKQVAQVKDGFKELRSRMRVNGERGVMVAVRQRSGSNTVQVSNRVLKILPRLKSELPEGVTLTLVRDTADFIRKSIKQVQQVAFIGGILAIVILFAFLRNIRSTIIISTSIPIAIWSTFFLLERIGLTINMMSLGGLALGIGMILDSSIVVLENIFRHREEGKGAIEGAIEGSGEVGMAITASTLTTICVFLPLLFLKGVEGVMFKQMALTVTFSLVAALIVALSLIPMLSSRLLRVEKKEGGGVSPRFYEGYLRGLGWSLKHRKTVLGGSVLLLFLAFWSLQLKGVGTALLPEIDEGVINGNIEMPVGTRLDITSKVTREVEETILRDVPENRRMFSRSGSHWRRGGGSHIAYFRVYLVDKNDRKRSTEEIVAGLRLNLADIPAAKIRISEGRSMYSRFLGGGREERLEMDIKGYDLVKGKALAEEVIGRIKGVEGVIYPRMSLEDNRPELKIIIDRSKAATLGLPISRILHVINTNIEGTAASKYREEGDEFDILVRLREEDRGSLEDILNMSITGPGGKEIPLRGFATVIEGKGPTRIDRRNQERLITVMAGIQGRDMGHIVQEITEKIGDLKLPPNFRLNFASEYEQQKEAFGGLLFAIILAIVLVYMVMASQFESLTEPFVIMFTIPLASIGVILAILVLHMNVTVPALIGGVLLIGIVVNNGIVMIDYINRLRKKEHPLREAILIGAKRRLRPIMMTTLTTSLALVPMALGFGEGSEMNAPMARVVIGGMLVSALFTIFFVPTLYGSIKGIGRNDSIKET
ncbi:MAG: efflux RND transporter permease subunit, partial [Deltaproteobacteria bacterium]|nr:efflux RND transporter permease subunit [Deltaproteobacteria bacterium]